MRFNIEYDKQPTRFLKQQDKHISQRLINKIETILSNNPVPHDSKRVQDKKDLVFRIRFGEQRILYRFNYQSSKIIIIKIDKRSRAYN
jgi:mRNA-degrading endonuclease RelE of RelBE toxin-antitoxin system